MGPVQSLADGRSTARRSRVVRRRHPRTRLPLHQRVRQNGAGIRHWVVVALLAWALAALVSQALGRADEARNRWGRTTTVWVAERPLRAGDHISGAARSRSWPAALVPDAALDTLPANARAAGPIDAGAPITARSVERSTVRHQTIAVPVGEAHLTVHEGDRVDIWSTGDPATVADGDPSTRRVATGARVASSSDRSVVLEVTPSQVGAVADAAATSTITLVGVP